MAGLVKPDEDYYDIISTESEPLDFRHYAGIYHYGIRNFWLIFQYQKKTFIILNRISLTQRTIWAFWVLNPHEWSLAKQSS